MTCPAGDVQLTSRLVAEPDVAVTVSAVGGVGVFTSVRLIVTVMVSVSVPSETVTVTE